MLQTAMSGCQSSLSYIQGKLDILSAVQKIVGVQKVGFVDVDVTQEQCDGLQWQINLTCHQIEVVNVARKPQICVRTALVGRNDDLTVLNLELHQRQTRLLVGFHSCFTQEQDIVLISLCSNDYFLLFFFSALIFLTSAGSFLK